MAGESVWINVNCVETQSGNPSTLSIVAYIEILDRQNLPVHQVKCRLENGQALFQVKLSDTLSTGNYLLRGYTKWMRNFDEQFYARKVISIINPFKSNSMPDGEKLFSMDTIIIYPEGGKILAKTENKLLIRSLDSYGNPISLNGSIVSEQNDTIIFFSTNNQGFAKINFNSENAGNYSFIYTSNGIRNALNLPKIEESGYILRIVDQTPEKIVLKAFSTVNNMPENLFIDICTIDGSFIEKYKLNEKSEIIVPNKFEGNRILNAILKDETNMVLSARPFKTGDRDSVSHLSIILNKEKFKTRDKVILKIKNNYPSYELNNISVSVARKCLINDNQMFRFIGKTESKFIGFIESRTDSFVHYNDLLLMIDPNHQIFSNKSNNIYLPELKGEIISGTIKNTTSNGAIANQKILLNVVGKSPIFELVTTDSMGRFNFVVNQYGEKEIVIQPLNFDSLHLDYTVNIDPSFSDAFGKQSTGNFSMTLDQAREINEVMVNMQINSLYKIQNQIVSKDAFKIEPFYGTPHFSVKTDRFIKLGSVEEIVKELVPLTLIRKQKGQTTFRVIEEKGSYTNETSTLTFIDGIPIYEVKRILDIPPSEIEKVEVVNLSYFMEDINLGYLLFFYTANANLKAMDFDKRIFRQAWQFYTNNHSFIVPDYQNEINKANRIPDFRNLLYYQTIPSLKNNEANFTFYTGDEAAEYIIVLEGIKPDGSIERTVFPLYVED